MARSDAQQLCVHGHPKRVDHFVLLVFRHPETVKMAHQAITDLTGIEVSPSRQLACHFCSNIPDAADTLAQRKCDDPASWRRLIETGPIHAALSWLLHKRLWSSPRA